MAAASNNVSTGSGTSEAWPQWKIGLAVGTPVALVLGGIWYYRRRQRNSKNTKPKGGNAGDPLEHDVEKLSPSPTKSDPDVASGSDQKESTPLEKAQAEKNKGNKYFKAGRYDQAIVCYTNAIDMCPPDQRGELATFYHNRAAAHEKLKNLKSVVEDTTKAIEYNKKYVKALTRRAAACEQLGNLSQSLEDVTALCILEGFQNPASLQTADRVLKKLGQTKAKESFKNRKPCAPSKHYIRTFFKAFMNDPILLAVKNLSSVDDKLQNGEPEEKESPYHMALMKVKKEEFDDVINLCSKQLKQEDGENAIEARLLRATFYLLSNQYELAVVDLDYLLNQENIEKKMKVNAYIKRASILIQQGKTIEGLDDFATAVRMDPENADIYHHRGHHNIQLDNLDDAIIDLENAMSKSPSFAASHVQRSFAEHKKSATQMAAMNLPLPQAVLQSYKANVEMFPDYGDARALYAQALGDAGKFDEADKQFQKAIELDPDNATALVHRGLLHLQSNKDIKEAIKMINKALEIDSCCEYAYEVLGTLEVQQGHMDIALSHFQKAIDYSRTESEMAHLYSLLDAAKAQLNVAKNLGIQLPSFGGAM